jgi:chemotaxis protein methyltransferase CheR
MVIDLTPFREIVRASSGLDYRDDKATLLQRVVAERIEALGISGPEGYLQRLQSDAEERQQLIDLLTINETYFFREPAQIDWLVGKLFAEHYRSSPARSFRLLSLGCSSGEEPYSIAMAVAERFGEEALERVVLGGADIDRSTLRLAAEGSFPRSSFRSTAKALVDRYFTPLAGGRYRLHESLRSRVTFHHLNLLDTVWPEELAGQDVVIFRNVSIYFDRATREAIQQRIAEILVEGGVLIMSATETLSNRFGLLQLFEEDGLFLFRKSVAVIRKDRVAPFPAVVDRPATLAVGWRGGDDLAGGTAEERYRSALAALAEGRIGEAATAADSLIESYPQQPRYRRLKAVVHLRHEELEEAERETRQALVTARFDPELHFLLGRILRWREDLPGAIDAFRSVVFERPDDWQAHYHLAELYRASGEWALARRSYQRLLQLLPQRGEVCEDPLLEPVVVPKAEVEFLARRHLARLDELKEV